MLSTNTKLQSIKSKIILQCVTIIYTFVDRFSDLNINKLVKGHPRASSFACSKTCSVIKFLFYKA